MHSLRNTCNYHSQKRHSSGILIYLKLLFRKTVILIQKLPDMQQIQNKQKTNHYFQNIGIYRIVMDWILFKQGVIVQGSSSTSYP